MSNINNEKYENTNKRIDNLKSTMSFILDNIHDLFISVIDETPEFFECMTKEFDEYKELIKKI